jgi:hypothetical protein
MQTTSSSLESAAGLEFDLKWNHASLITLVFILFLAVLVYL